MEGLQAELEVLKAILMNDVVVHDPSPDNSIRVEYTLESCSFSVEVEAGSYHSEIPRIEVSTHHTNHVHIDGNVLKQHLIRTVQDSLEEKFLYLLFQAAQDWIKDNVKTSSDDSDSDDSAATRPVCKYFLEGRCRFNERCHNFHPESQAAQEATVGQTSHQSETTKVNIDTEVTKKPPMRTATDVISRIQWDPVLSESDFIIGYSDRFIGIVEKQFSEFNWEDIATVSLDVLAIPKHRIQYFKYKDEIVWDRRVQLDNFFGSRGNGTKIHSLLKQDTAKTIAVA